MTSGTTDQLTRPASQRNGGAVCAPVQRSTAGTYLTGLVAAAWMLRGGE
ncbi:MULTISPECIES: hypothetical protein [Mycobacterium]|nr:MULTISPECIES: hypothetical protein [Mycobacterium]AXN47392.1 hypothetical protein MM1218R_05494 [Mycobacterium marinum]AXN52826.1 hypothetical protein CCUG20998_05457 [Mycobacterium marinum]MDC8973926.1 hypothetical protein [Mycobacterium marinum]MDC8984025.1 hypothetical protein [Mycobacterium marinum]MDC8995606.1 hypothetical protein [Mycobacterium marinum]